MDWQRKDELVNRCLIEWHTLNRVAEAFGIEYETTERAHDFSHRIECWLRGENDGRDFV